jgi:pyruvate-ferredoxin/flavodoxin oxidoreductase
MASFTNSTLRLLRRLLGPSPRGDGPYAGLPTVLDGNSAVAVTEASLAETAALGASFPADAAALVWRSEQARQGINLSGAPLAALAAEGPRGALAIATGLSLAGTRVACFLASPDLAGSLDLLTAAAGRHLPLVIQVANRALPSHAATLGSGHEALHLAAESGCFVLVAATVQQAVDFTLIARRVAERTLVPGLVVCDGGETALGIQEVKLAPPELVREFLGSPDDEIPAPTSAQELVFGAARRRVPRWHDPDRPALLGGAESGTVWGLGSAAQRAYFESPLAACLNEACSRFEQLTGRSNPAVSAFQMQDSPLVLVAQGAAIETAQAVADGLRRTLKVGVIGIHALRPFPGAEIARLLGQGQRVCVLERLDSPLASDPPLLREVRAALGRALDNGRYGATLHPGYPALSEGQMPRWLSVAYGLGGLPLRAADLVELCRKAGRIDRSRVYLGMNFAPSASLYPKRQVLLDRLRRAHPEIADLGIAAVEPAPDLRPHGALSLALHRISGQLGEGLVAEISALLHHALKGQVRARPALTAEPWGALCVDRIARADAQLRDLGDDLPVDLALVVAPATTPGLDPLAELTPKGAVLVATPLSGETLWQSLRPATRRALLDPQRGLYLLPLTAESNSDYLLGGLCAALVNHGLLEISPRRWTSAREALLKQAVAAVQPPLEAFKSGLAAVIKLDPSAYASDQPAPAAEPDAAPAALRQFGPSDDGYDSLPRFWDQVGVLHRHGATAELAPDPYLALGAMPPLSAGLRDLSPLRTRMPAFDPALCTGCGACWSVCPDAAIGVRLFTPRRLLDIGLRLGGGEGLGPMAARLAKQMGKLCLATQAPAPARADELMERAYAEARQQAPLPTERAAAAAATVAAWKEAIGPTPLAATEIFFQRPEQESHGAGALLTLAVNPDACKSCGLCVAHCPTQALSGAPQDPAGVQRTRRQWERLQSFPSGPPAGFEPTAIDPEAGPLAAAFLAQRPAAAMSGGDGAEPGSGARLALRQVLAAAEARLADAQQQWAEQVRSAREGIARLIRAALADALPADDLEGLAQGLAAVETRQTELRALIGAAEERLDLAIDAARLRRLVGLAQSLGALSERLDQGRQGMGRARLGVALTSGLAQGGVGVFPHNPFAQPAVVDLTGDGAALAAGLLEGQLRQAAADFALVRKARLELDHPDEAPRRWAELDHLSWRELTPEERAACPSLLLVGGADILAGRGLAQLFHLLGSDLPIRVMALSELDLGLAPRAGMDADVAPVADSGIKLGLLALAQRHVLVAQTSIAAPGHLYASCQAAFGHPGPALLHLYAPSPSRHGFPTRQTVARAELATASRLFPLFRYDPAAPGLFGTRLDLGDNPALLSDWLAEEGAAPLTPAQWALGEQRYAEFFSDLRESDPAPTDLAEYLALDAPQRVGKTPVAALAGNGEAPRRYHRVDPRLVQVCEQQRDAWRTLQELAGWVTPFTARVRAEAEAAVATERQAELAEQKARYEQRLERLREELFAEVRQDMRVRLMALAGYPPPTDSPGRVN